MYTSTTLRTQQVSLRFSVLLLALMGLLLFGAKSSQAAEETYFNTLNPETGAIVKSWKIEQFALESPDGNSAVSEVNLTWTMNTVSSFLQEAAITNSPIAAASITVYKNGKKALTYSFTHLQVLTLQYSSNGLDTPIENATLTFQNVTLIYYPSVASDRFHPWR